MLKNICGFMVLLTISILSFLITYISTRKGLHQLLDEVIKIPSGTTFYMRIFSIGLLFIVLSASLGIAFDLKAEARLMEYIWKIAGGLSSTFANLCLFLLGYLTLVTILLAVLKGKHG